MDSDLEDEVNFIKTLIKSKNNNKAIFVQQKKLKNTTLSFLFWSFCPLCHSKNLMLELLLFL